MPLEFDRHKWCTSRNLRKYYDIIRDTALEHGLAVKNDSFVPGVPYTEEIYWTKPGRVCEMDAARNTTDMANKQKANQNMHKCVKSRASDKAETIVNKIRVAYESGFSKSNSSAVWGEPW